MLKELVQFLVGSASADRAISKVSTSAHLIVLDEQHKIENIENQLPERVRFRTCTQTGSFFNFVKVTQMVHEAVCYINAKDMTATSYFNLGNEKTPGHGDWTARLTMEQTPEYSTLLKFADNKASQQAVAEFLEDWNHLLTAGLDGNENNIASAIKSVRNINIKTERNTDHSVENYSAEKSDIEKIEARRKGGEALPDGFVFRCAPYHGMEERDIQLRMSLHIGHGEPMLTLRVVRPKTLEMEIANEFKDMLKVNLRDKDVIIGTLTVVK